MLAALRVRRLCTLPSSATAASFDALLLQPTVATTSSADCCAAAADVRPALSPASLSFSCMLHLCSESVSLEACWTAATSRMSPPPGASGFTSSLPPSTPRWPSCLRLASAFSRSCLCRWKSHVDSCRGGGRGKREISAIRPRCFQQAWPYVSSSGTKSDSYLGFSASKHKRGWVAGGVTGLKISVLQARR